MVGHGQFAGGVCKYERAGRERLLRQIHIETKFDQHCNHELQLSNQKQSYTTVVHSRAVTDLVVRQKTTHVRDLHTLPENRPSTGGYVAQRVVVPFDVRAGTDMICDCKGYGVQLQMSYSKLYMLPLNGHTPWNSIS